MFLHTFVQAFSDCIVLGIITKYYGFNKISKQHENECVTLYDTNITEYSEDDVQKQREATFICDEKSDDESECSDDIRGHEDDRCIYMVMLVMLKASMALAAMHCMYIHYVYSESFNWTITMFEWVG